MKYSFMPQHGYTLKNAKWEKTIKGHMLYDSTHVKYLKLVNSF